MKNWLLLIVLVLSLAGHARAQQARRLTGQVLDDANGQGLPGVTVVVKNTTTGASTDGDGHFTLDVPAGAATLVFSYVGYLPVTLPVGENATVKVRLKADQKALDEVVVIGYGEVKKSDVTGAIVSVKAEDLKKVPTSNVMESLQGRLPGVDITRSSGAAGSGVNITVRGNRSLSANNGPLFIVDGVQYNSIQDINPNDIQSMEVLKDAASTAVYGARGANGVIIVTTKKGASGKTTVSLNSYIGQSEVVSYPAVLTGPEYIAQKREANRTTGLWTSPADDPKIFGAAYQREALASGAWTDWSGLLLRKGVQQNHQVGIGGGGENTKFYLSFDYFNEKGVFRLDQLRRYTTRFNLEHAVSSKVKVGLQSQLTYYNQNVRRDPLNLANKIDPLTTPTDGNGVFQNILQNGRDINPLADEQPGNYENNVRTTRTFLTAFAQYQIATGLSLRSNLGLTLANARTGIYRGSNTIDMAGSTPQSFYGVDFTTNWSWENILNYSKTFGDHSISATAVSSLLTFNTELQTAQGRNQLLGYQLYYALANANQQMGINSAYVNSKLISFTGRVQYGYKSRYLLTLTGRQDYSSKLAAGHKGAFFPSAAVAWRIIDESFLQGQDIVSDLKLRASYGLAGNYDVPAYSSQSLLTRIPFAFGDNSAPAYVFASRIGNLDLTWEKSTTKNVGLDFGLLGNRLTGSVDVYETLTRDLLIDRFLPATSGVGVITQNVGRTRNRGIELGLNGRVIDNEHVKWNLGATWFKNQEEIQQLATAADDIANGWFVGYPTRVFYDYEKIGIWQLNEADEARSFGQKPGQIKVKDQNGDGLITAAADRKVLGSALPKWSASLNSDVSWKGFDLSMQWFARYGQLIRYEYDQLWDPQGVENSSKQDYWTPENPTNSFPRPDASLSKSTLQNSLYGNTLAYRDGSYLKLRAVTLGYSVPAGVLEKIGVSSARVYVQGKNLWVVSNIPDYDPERAASAATSAPEQVFTSSTSSAGLAVGLSPLSNPIPRLVLVGVNLSF
ncbi:TonB-dependent receptor [Hymenobacter sp. BT175]|uniref:SusC/RagA family TonB-linked outer membrane protein n=1 Tax=Hymenobacter translucens TaxID=2886507 RepID=UPI001D0EAB1A|nr:TonB-dependent receptor [Hymenobacter translucens]MCC2547164.1 TonB-dependent receptor [Hymenobacter translucens]